MIVISDLSSIFEDGSHEIVEESHSGRWEQVRVGVLWVAALKQYADGACCL
jgi:hypothetical protein